MVALSDTDKSRVRYHLAYSDAVEDGDLATLNDRMDYCPDSYTRGKWIEILDICDIAEGRIPIGAQETSISEKRILLGDVNRTDVTYSSEDVKARRKEYIHWTDYLALKMGVVNYQKESAWRDMSYRRSGAKVPRLAGPVETVYNLSFSDLFLWYA